MLESEKNMKFTVIDTKADNWYSDLDYVEKGGFRGDFGYVYILEAGNRVKIGCTCSLKDRYSTLTSWMKRYAGVTCGRLAVSERHRSFRNTERAVHEFMREYRISDSEMFVLSFDDALKMLESFEYDTKFYDELEQAKSERSNEKLNNLISLVCPKIEPTKMKQPDFDKVSLDLYNSLDKYLDCKFRKDYGLDPDKPSPMELLEVISSEDFCYYGTKFQGQEAFAVDVGLFLSELCKDGGNIRVKIEYEGETYEFGLTHN